MTQDTEDVVARVRQAILKGAFNNDPQWQAMATAAAIAAIEVLQPDRQSLSDRIDVLTQALREARTWVEFYGGDWGSLGSVLQEIDAALHQEGIATDVGR